MQTIPLRAKVWLVAKIESQSCANRSVVLTAFVQDNMQTLFGTRKGVVIVKVGIISLSVQKRNLTGEKDESKNATGRRRKE